MNLSIFNFSKAIQEPMEEHTGRMHHEKTMGEGLFSIPAVEQKLKTARNLRKRAYELEMEAKEEHNKYLRQFVRNMKDKELNRTQCLNYLSISTIKTLREWEAKYNPYGYLQFNDDKIMRSELLTFIDDRQSGKIARMMESGLKSQAHTVKDKDFNTTFESAESTQQIIHKHSRKPHAEAVT